MVRCPNGHENPDDYVYCGECGARIVAQHRRTGVLSPTDIPRPPATVDVSHPGGNVVVTRIHFAVALPPPPVTLASGYESGNDISYHFAQNNIEFGFAVQEASGFQIGRVFNNDWKHDNQQVDRDTNTYFVAADVPGTGRRPSRT